MDLALASTEPTSAAALPAQLPPPEPFPDPEEWQPECEDDTFSYGRRVVYTDGSAKGATFARKWRRAGYGIAWGKHHAQNIAAPLRGPWQSSQRAELTAALHAMHIHPSGPLRIRTDSR